MKISVGIHQNVVIKNAAINDKGRLVLSLKQLSEGQEEEEKEVDPFDKMNASEVVEKDSAGGIILWPFKAPEDKTKEGNARTLAEMAEEATDNIMRLKNQLQFILEQYTVRDNIKWSIFDGAAITKDTYQEDIISQTNLDVIYKNICEQFIAVMQPFLDKDEFKMRLKLPRQSKEKHFVRLPDRYLKEQPFIEPMSVPENLTKVKWSDYEIKQGLNDPTPVSRTAADPVEDPKEGEESVFGQR